MPSIKYKKKTYAGATFPVLEMTKAEYDALPESKKMDGTVYMITDDTGGWEAENASYDNSESGLTATNVQDALDEISNELATTVTTISRSAFYKSGNVVTVKLAENNVTVSANIAFITIPPGLRPQTDMDYTEPLNGKRIFFCADGRLCFNENVSNLTVRGAYTYII